MNWWKNFKSFLRRNRKKTLQVLSVIIISLTGGIIYMYRNPSIIERENVPLSFIMQKVMSHNQDPCIKSVNIYPNRIVCHTLDEHHYSATKFQNDHVIVHCCIENNVVTNISRIDVSQQMFRVIFSILIQLISMFVQYRIMRSLFMVSMKEEKKKINMKKTTFKDVVGMEYIKKELLRAFEVIKNPKKFVNMGLSIQNSILMYGPPGNGKTMVARALAGETSSSFIYKNGASFVDLYVGNGPRKVRKLFREARESAEKYGSCIVFIDEIDALGSRGGNDSNTERDSTINQMLSEIDGVEDMSRILVICATNRMKNLDSALLRDGRFGTKLHVGDPREKDRTRLIEFVMKKFNMQLSSTLTVSDLVNITSGESRVSIRALLESAVKLNVENDSGYMIGLESILESQIRKELGPKDEEKPKTNDKNFINTVYHEAGHAYMSYVFRQYLPPMIYATSERRGNVLGFIQSQPLSENKSRTLNYMKSYMKMGVAGRLCEEIFCNDSLSMGCSSDLNTVRQIAEQYVMFGLDDSYGLVFQNKMSQPSEYAKSLFDKAVNNLILEATTEAKKILTEEKSKSKIHHFCKELIKHRNIYGNDIYRVFDGEKLCVDLTIYKSGSIFEYAS